MEAKQLKQKKHYSKVRHAVRRHDTWDYKEVQQVFKMSCNEMTNCNLWNEVGRWKGVKSKRYMTWLHKPRTDTQLSVLICPQQSRDREMLSSINVCVCDSKCHQVKVICSCGSSKLFTKKPGQNKLLVQLGQETDGINQTSSASKNGITWNAP